MKKIAIVTITNGSNNYGNILQNYALQTFLQELGYYAVTLKNISFSEHRQSLRYLIRLYTKEKTKFWRELCFRRFKKYIKYDSMIITKDTEDFTELVDRYDCFVCGSDQVWNPTFPTNRNWRFNLLMFCPQEKKFSYAASIGLDTLTNAQEELLGEPLKDFKSISMREKTGCQIIKKITGRNSQLSVDPVFLIDDSSWKNIMKPIKSIGRKKTLFYYWLGDERQGVKDVAMEYTQTHNLKFVDILNTNYRSGLGPENFLWLISNSSLVITDSFHAVAFSIIFRKQFLVYERNGSEKKTFDRIKTLLDTYGLTGHICYEGTDIEKKIMRIQMNDYSEIIEEAREKATKYLIENIEDN